MSKILLINQSSGYLFNDIAEAFQIKKLDTYLFTGNIKPNDDILEGVLKIKSIKYNKKNIFTRLFTWILFSIHLYIHLIFNRDYDYILVSSNPPISIYIIPYLVRKTTKLNYLIFDLYPDILTASGIITKRNFIYKLLFGLNKHVFNKSDNVFTIGYSLKSQIEHYVKNKEKITVINLWIPSELSSYHFEKKHSFFSKDKYENSTVVAYSGNLGKTHDFKKLLESILELSECNSIKFIIAGEGIQKKEILDFISKHSLKNVEIFPHLNYNHYLQLLSITDIAFVSQEKGFENFSIPSKIFSNLIAGNAVVAQTQRGSDLDLLVNDFKIGDVIYNDSNMNLSSIIRTIHNNHEMLIDYKKNSRSASLNFTKENANLYLNKILIK
jgi:hypothetical protein